MVEEKKKKLILTLDFGGSATKIIGGLSGAKRKAIVMNPEICEMPLESLQSKSMSGVKGARQNRAWIGLNGEYFAVGYLAKNYLATPQLKPLKASLAIPKILSACWVYSDKFKSLNNEFDLALACFLPPGEYDDRAEFEKELRSALSEFETPDGIFKVSLKDFECKPEAGGVFMEHWRLEKETASNALCVNLMFGYRNASALLVERGNVGKFQTTDLGFIQMVESVQQKTSGYTIEKLTGAIARWDGNDDSCLMSVLRQETKEAKVIELDNLKSQIQIARIEYLSRLKSWLREVVPKDVDQIVISGGTADYLKPDLKEWAKTVSPVTLFWHGGVKLPEDIQAVGLGNRMADVWVLWHYFCIEIKKKNRVVK